LQETEESLHTMRNDNMEHSGRRTQISVTFECEGTGTSSLWCDSRALHQI